MNRKQVVIRFLKSYILYILSAFGVSISVVANVGVSSYNAMNLAIATAGGIKIGTVTIFMNMTFLILYMVLTRFKYSIKYVIQALAVTLFGTLINFFVYGVFGQMGDIPYWGRITMIIVGTMIGGFSIGGIVHYNAITFPLESFCLEVSQIRPISFMKMRYLIDVFSIMVSLTLSLSFHLPLFVREGTLISMLLLSFIMHHSKDLFDRMATKTKNLQNSHQR